MTNSTETPAPGKPWYRRVPWWGWVAGVAALLVIGGIYNAVNPKGAATPQTAATSAPATEAPAPTASVPAPAVTETKPEPTPTPQAPAFAASVWAKVLANFSDGTVPPDSPLVAVTGVEDISSGTIRVLVQEPLTKPGRVEVARHVFNLGGGMDTTDLKVVVVRDASGVDSNHYRSDFPYLPQ
ncbi:hypothetical protein [Microbacterium sp. NPDC056052]|uniref:hypothetical protein n=1 Tax=Microbacterium sp. NPDC056052 TaxID=3345695 RepID=UPI0035E0B645